VRTIGPSLPALRRRIDQTSALFVWSGPDNIG
jgi:hypothetical protein